MERKMKNSNIPNNSKLRRRLLALYHQDGILDLVVSLCLALLALVMGFEQTAFIGLIGIPAIFYIPLKNQISVPRIGLIRFESPKKSRHLLRIIALLGLALLILFVLAYTLLSGSGAALEMIWRNDILIFAALLAAFLFIMGALLKNKRFMIYAVVSLFLVALSQLLSFRLWISVAGLALIMFLAGATLFIRFRRQYPAPDGE
jgi:hypothetical protein